MHSWLTRCSIGLASGAVAGALVLAPAGAHAAGTDVVITTPPASTTPEAEPTTTAPVSPEVEVEQTAVKQDPQAHGDASVKRTAVAAFRMAGVTWDASSSATDVTVRVQVRTHGTWGDWETLELEENFEDGRPGTTPLWTEAPADGIAVDVQAASGALAGVKVTTIDPGKAEVVTPITSAVYDPAAGSVTSAAATTDGTPSVVPMPTIITRAQWKAGAGTKCDTPTTRPKALGVVIHHTAGSNTYAKADAAALVRSYQTYHVKGHGWCDIGYNFLVDRFGQIFEGRKGGLKNQVRAAHSGVDAVNQWATGVSMMGNFEKVAPSEALKTAVVKLVGWRLKYFGANPKGTYTTGGRKYQVINGHRDVKSTACPGKYAYSWINAVGGLRDRVATYVSKAKSAAGAPSAPTAVKYAAPKGVKVTVSTTSAKVSWSAVAGAPGYRVLVSPTGSSTNAKYYRVTGTSTTITGLSARKTYVFRVAVIVPTTGERLSSYTAKPYTSATMMGFTAPTGLKAAKATSSTLTVSWAAQAGAPGYRLMVVKAGESTGKKFYSVRTNTATATGLKPGTKYLFRVAVINPSTTERLGGYSVAPYPTASTLAASAAPAPAPTTTPPASAAKNAVSVAAGGKVVFKGHGYGHGIGMSQYGAEGGARAGHKYDAILKKYYPGTTLGTKSATIRVQITADTTNSVYVKPASGLKFRDLSTNAVVTLPGTTSGRKVSAWSIDNAKANRKKNSLFYKSGSKWYTYKTVAGSAQFEGPSSIALVMPNGSTRAYRGALRSAKPSSGSTARDTVNVLSLEAYTQGVVAREMPSSWSLEALKAQSVAARTYASRYLGSSKHYDICDTTSCQVYGGLSAETTRSNQAVAGTKGRILTFGGKPALTQFSSSSGGYTNRGSFSYLAPVADPWDNWSGNKNHAWSITVTASTIQKKYSSIGTLKSISITKRNGLGDQGGRVSSMTLKGSKGSKTITGVDARWAFGLRSDWFGF